MTDPFQVILVVLTRLYQIGGFLLSLWWVYLPFFLGWLAKDVWVQYCRNRFIHQMEWILLEIVPPREVKRTPEVMEQFFAGLHGAHSPLNWGEWFWKGETQSWFSLEVVSLGGEVHFYIRTLAKFRDLIEAQIYAQYPEAEIREVADYIDSLPLNLPNEDYNVWGTEMEFVNKDAYPIRTYKESGKGVNILKEEERVDPMFSLLEALNKIKAGEHFWIQILVRPLLDEWKAAAQEEKNKLIGRKTKKKEGELKKEIIAWKEAGKEVAHHLITGKLISGKLEGEEEPSTLLWMTKGETEIVNAIENKMNKMAFESVIRMVYLGRRDIFSPSPHVNSVIGSLKQFSAQNLNGFKPNGKTATSIDYKIKLKETRLAYRRKRIFADYRKRAFVQYSKYISYLRPLIFYRFPIFNWFFMRSKPMILNIEELASIYHFPALMRTPMTLRVEAKKSEPPAGLPVE